MIINLLIFIISYQITKEIIKLNKLKQQTKWKKELK